MLNQLKKQLKQINLSGIRQFNEMAANVSDCISLTLGEPDFNTPDEIKLAVKEAIDQNKCHYSTTMGDLDLRRKIAVYEWKNHHLLYDADEIMITAGASEAISTALAAIIDQGDEIIIPTPCYPQYEAIITLEGGIFVPLNTQDHDFQITYEELNRCFTDKTKAIVLTSPNNPSGSIYHQETLQTIYEFVKDKQIFVLCDEVYNQLIYTDKYHSFMQFQDLRKKILAAQSFSKPYAMTGWRLGYLMGDKKILAEIMKLHQYRYSCVNTFVQKAGIKALETDSKAMLTSYQLRRDIAYQRLIAMGLSVHLPEGAFYLFPNISEFGLDSMTFCTRLLYEFKVACVPGSYFHAEGYLRISYCVDLKQLINGLDRLEAFIHSLRS